MKRFSKERTYTELKEIIKKNRNKKIVIGLIIIIILTAIIGV